MLNAAFHVQSAHLLFFAGEKSLMCLYSYLMVQLASPLMTSTLKSGIF